MSTALYFGIPEVGTGVSCRFAQTSYLNLWAYQIPSFQMEEIKPPHFTYIGEPSS